MGPYLLKRALNYESPLKVGLKGGLKGGLGGL